MPPVSVAAPPVFPPAAVSIEMLSAAQLQVEAEIKAAEMQMHQYMLNMQQASGMIGPAYGFDPNMMAAMVAGNAAMQHAQPSEGDIAWIKDLKRHDQQTHCFVSTIAFEATPQEIYELFQTCGEIQFFHMPVTRTDKSGFNTVVGKQGQMYSHTGRAIIKFKDTDGLNNAIRVHHVAIKGVHCHFSLFALFFGSCFYFVKSFLQAAKSQSNWRNQRKQKNPPHLSLLKTKRARSWETNGGRICTPAKSKPTCTLRGSPSKAVRVT
jgi:hypothetical protein